MLSKRAVLFEMGAVVVAWGSAGCGPSSAAPPVSGTPDATVPSGTDAGPEADIADANGEAAPSIPADAMPPPGSFCSLPGSVVSTGQGNVVIPGGEAGVPDISWMQLPQGFCSHYFATVESVRQLRFAPSGELFAASPTTGTTGYGQGQGIAGIVVLPDDNHDGNADTNLTYLAGLPSIQGLMFSGSFFYYQDGTIVRRVPYQSGDRQASGASQVVTDMSNWPQATEHWPRVFDQAQDGTIYVTNGGSQSNVCVSTRPVLGGVFQLMGDGTTSVIAQGFRNPIALRCESTHDVCLAIELALDYSGNANGREKLVPVRTGDDWGYPCCATRDTPYAGVTYQDTGATPDCSGVATESDAFVIGHTPFGLDFETGQWPAPWTGRVFVTLHGVIGSLAGARVVGIALDGTGMPLPASEIDPTDATAGNMMDFATGWDDGRQDHGRPAPVTFAPDGRMFLGNDNDGSVIWIAPTTLMP